MNMPCNHNQELQREQDAYVAAELAHERKEAAIRDAMAFALSDPAEFETLVQNYEIIDSCQVQRALRELDKAIKGDRASIDALFTALSIIQADFKAAVEHEIKGSE